jgi:hypothetical protein
MTRKMLPDDEVAAREWLDHAARQLPARLRGGLERLLAGEEVFDAERRRIEGAHRKALAT